MYKRFPHIELIRNWKSLIEKDRDFVVDLEEEWKTIHKENEEKHRQVREERQQKISVVIKTLQAVGVDPMKYRKNGFLKQPSGYKAWFKNNVMKEIEKEYPSYRGNLPVAGMRTEEVDGITLSNNQSPTRLTELYDRLLLQYKQGKVKSQKNNDLLIRSIEYATFNEIDIQGMPTDEIVSLL